MVIILLTVVVAALLRAPLEGNWFLAILIPFEVVYAVICWLAMAQSCIQTTGEARRNVGWGTRIFAPELVFLCLPMLIKAAGSELVQRWRLTC